MSQRGQAHVTDRRVQKTQGLLREALHSLIAEKPYDAIVVKEILDRANVGRSTFYTHFRDKDELLVSSIYEMVHSVRATAPLRSGPWYEKVVWFSLPIFEYHQRHRSNGNTGMGVRGRTVLHDHLRRTLSQMAGDAIAAEPRRSRKAARSIAPDLLAGYVASTFVLVFSWWLESKKPLSPKEIDELFRTLVLPALTAS